MQKCVLSDEYLQIYYNSEDISADVSVRNATAYDCEGGGARTGVELRFTDVRGAAAAQGDALRHGHYDSGVHIDRITLERDTCTLQAVSSPADIRQPSWQMPEAVTLKKAASEICARHGLELNMYDVPDVSYPKLRQDGQCGLDWLAHRCLLEGCALKLMGRCAAICNVKLRWPRSPICAAGALKSVRSPTASIAARMASSQSGSKRLVSRLFSGPDASFRAAHPFRAAAAQ